MPLPGKTSPTANPNAAKQPPASASKGKSRLPALPQGGLKPKNSITFLEIPKTMDRCFYVVRVEQVKLGTSTKTNLDRVEMKFTVLETDVKEVKVGSTAFEYLDMQGERSLYFWSNFATFVLAASGQDPTDAEALAGFESDSEANFWEVVDEGKQPLAGALALRRFRRGMKKDGVSPTWYADWESVSEEQAAQYATVVATELTE